ncbi:MAG TPA: GxxExxY protein [Acetobacteraceae bacterium]|nr:GxxExxY protein [Acetobacteraceae bacterium]
MRISGQVIGLAIEVHPQLGPGLLESAYEECLCQELRDAGILFARQVVLPIIYKGRRLNFEYRMDVVVEPGLVLEIKSVASLLPLHDAQLLTYLRLSGHRVGLLMNFNAPVLKDGIRRRVP